YFAPARAHLNVRWVEQQKCLASLLEGRAVWIVAEWGMGADGFVSSILVHRGHTGRPTYRLDLGEYTSRDQFLDSIKQTIECSFERFCDVVSNAGPAYLLLDNFVTGLATVEGSLSPERDLEHLVTTILEYCPELRVFMRVRRVPQHHNFPVVELKALDEADL